MDRDISKNNLSACFFTDRDQSMFLTLPAGMRFWYTFGTGYLQRYYDIPFTEFDLDIYYFRLKVNKRIKNLGTVSFQVDRASAENTTYKKTAVSSDFDRSYESVEWYLPIKFDRSLDYFDHIGDLIKHTLLFLLIICLDINTTLKIFIIIILAALVLMLNIHLAAQQCYSKNDDSVLNNLKFLCRKKEDIKFFRYFGVGTFELTVFFILFNLGFIVN